MEQLLILLGGVVVVADFVGLGQLEQEIILLPNTPLVSWQCEECDAQSPPPNRKLKRGHFDKMFLTGVNDVIQTPPPHQGQSADNLVTHAPVS